MDTAISKGIFFERIIPINEAQSNKSVTNALKYVIDNLSQPALNHLTEILIRKQNTLKLTKYSHFLTSFMIIDEKTVIVEHLLKMKDEIFIPSKISILQKNSNPELFDKILLSFDKITQTNTSNTSLQNLGDALNDKLKDCQTKYEYQVEKLSKKRNLVSNIPVYDITNEYEEVNEDELLEESKLFEIFLSAKEDLDRCSFNSYQFEDKIKNYNSII